jgi:hypothetical protein
LGHTFDLPLGDLAMLVTPGSRGVDAQHHQLGRAVHRLEFRAEVSDVAGIAAAQTRPEVEQLHVVIAWNGQHRSSEAIRERTCCPELRRACALGDVA